MKEIDIRHNEDQSVEIIRFADLGATLATSEGHAAIELQMIENSHISINSEAEVTIGRSGERNYVFLSSLEDAENLIKALQKAIELGWWK